MLRAIIFDLDNTLYDADAAYRLALEDCVPTILNENYMEARRQVKNLLPKGHVAARNRLLYFKSHLDSTGHFSANELLSMIGSYETSLVRHIRRQWLTLERASLIEQIAVKYRLAIITNENLRTQMIKMSAIDPSGRYFPIVICSEELGVEKPNTMLFSHALSRLSLCANECLMIGDDLKNDIEPAVSIGMRAILTREFKKQSQALLPAGNTFSVVNKLTEIIGLIK